MSFLVDVLCFGNFISTNEDGHFELFVVRSLKAHAWVRARAAPNNQALRPQPSHRNQGKSGWRLEENLPHGR
jgi:hypothetical protein